VLKLGSDREDQERVKIAESTVMKGFEALKQFGDRNRDRDLAVDIRAFI